MLILSRCHPSYPRPSTQSPEIAAPWDWQYISGPVLSHRHPIMPSGVLGMECLNLSRKVLKDESDETLLLHYTDPFVLHWFKNYLSNLHSAVTLQYIDPAPVRNSSVQPCQPPLDAFLAHSKFFSSLWRSFTSSLYCNLHLAFSNFGILIILWLCFLPLSYISFFSFLFLLEFFVSSFLCFLSWNLDLKWHNKRLIQNQKEKNLPRAFFFFSRHFRRQHRTPKSPNQRQLPIGLRSSPLGHRLKPAPHRIHGCDWLGQLYSCKLHHESKVVWYTEASLTFFFLLHCLEELALR